MVEANRSTLLAYSIQHTTVCHAGQQWHGPHTVMQDSSNNQVQHGGGRLPETDGAKFLPTIRSGKPGHNLASIHQMAPPKRGSTQLIIALLLIYRSQKDERLSWPSWLTCSRTVYPHSGHLSAAGRAQDREISLAKYRVLPMCYATNHHWWTNTDWVTQVWSYYFSHWQH